MSNIASTAVVTVIALEKKLDLQHIVDCYFQRPRKLGAKLTGKDIAPDEHVQDNLDFDFEGKRDRWNGYDEADYKQVIDEFQKMEDAKRQLKAARMEKALIEGELDKSVAKVGTHVRS